MFRKLDEYICNFWENAYLFMYDLTGLRLGQVIIFNSIVYVATAYTVAKGFGTILIILLIGSWNMLWGIICSYLQKNERYDEINSIAIHNRSEPVLFVFRYFGIFMVVLWMFIFPTDNMVIISLGCIWFDIILRCIRVRERNRDRFKIPVLSPVKVGK